MGCGVDGLGFGLLIVVVIVGGYWGDVWVENVVDGGVLILI